MKKIIISLMVSLFIMFVVPMIMVWLFEPRDATFFEPSETPVATENAVEI